MIVYTWPGFRLEFDPNTGECYTRYADGTSSGCGVQTGDRWHAARLSITPPMHRLVHELLHHLVGVHVYDSVHGSPVVWRDAHGRPQEEGGEAKPGWTEAAREEWFVTALTYYVHDLPCDWGALTDLEREGVDVCALRDRVRYLIWAATLHPEDLTIQAATRTPEAA